MANQNKTKGQKSRPKQSEPALKKSKLETTTSGELEALMKHEKSVAILPDAKKSSPKTRPFIKLFNIATEATSTGI